MKTSNDRLRSARIAAGFKTARDAAQYHKWNENTYRGNECGHREISKKAAFKYAAAFNVGVVWLLTGNDDPREVAILGRIETFSEEVARLKSEIEDRQMRLAQLVFGSENLIRELTENIKKAGAGG